MQQAQTEESGDWKIISKHTEQRAVQVGSSRWCVCMCGLGVVWSGVFTSQPTGHECRAEVMLQAGIGKLMKKIFVLCVLQMIPQQGDWQKEVSQEKELAGGGGCNLVPKRPWTPLRCCTSDNRKICLQILAESSPKSTETAEKFWWLSQVTGKLGRM